MSDSFVHLHNHTEFSMLDGAARVNDIAKKAAEDGMPGLGITDHGNMYGVLDFYKACKKYEINPIIGTEAYMALESREERPRRGTKAVDDSGGETEQGQKLYYHVTLLAENNEGYKNLIQLASRAFLEGYYYKPRVDWEVLSDHAKGVIATSGCLGGQVLQALMAGDEDLATSRAARLQDIFGKDNFFIELQDHGIPEQKTTTPGLLSIAKRIGAPLLLTNDCHYTDREDHLAHDALLCVQTKAKISDKDRFKFHGHEHYLKTAEEMRLVFPDLPEASDNTLWIAERADVDIKFGDMHLPVFPFPDRYETDHDYLTALVLGGARKRWGDQLPAETSDRLSYELGVIRDMGFSSYFLIVWDLTRHAREQGIRMGPARGSAGGCAVAYCLGITEIDPIKYDLLFERFLNPSRVSMPDIDMDFDSRYRDEMIRYAVSKYGKDHVAQIVTFGSIKGRAAIRDAARVLDLPYALGDQISKAMPPMIAGRDTPLWACMEKHPKHEDGYERASGVRELYSGNDDAKKVIDVALGLEDLKRQYGIHAAAVVITPEPLTEYVPIQRTPEKDTPLEEAPIVTQYEMHGVEDLGLLKMDFLGLRNLDVIDITLELIEEYTGEKIDIMSVPLDDEKTFEMLRAGDSIGVFQLEGKQMRDLMKALAPTEFEDIPALVSLYRPGPMAANMHNDYADRKNGRKPVAFDHPVLEPILADTYGLMVYQEQLMRVAQALAGYSLAEADLLRKACGKKDREIIAREREKFIPAVVANGYSEELARSQFDIIEPFADYAFNRSHAVGYGMIAYQTAWLKANYPIYYMSALLTSVGTQDKLRVYLNECRRMGIVVTTPDVNVSYPDFRPVGDKIAFGLASVRNLGQQWGEAVVKAREDGPFKDFQDFCLRVDKTMLNSKFIESAIMAGGFDSIEKNRKGLVGVSKSIVKAVSKRKDVETTGQMDLFGAAGVDAGFNKIPVPNIEYDYLERLSLEKEMLGVFVSDNPLYAFEEQLKGRVDASIHDIVESEDGSRHVIGGLVTATKKLWTKKGDAMATLVLEDLRGEVEVILFPRAMKKYANLVKDDAILVVSGRYAVERREDANFVADDVEMIAGGESEDSDYVVSLPETADETALLALKGVLASHPGLTRVLLTLGGKKIALPDDMKVSPSLKLDIAVAKTLEKWR